MAEISALTPSPPGVGDPSHPSPPSAPHSIPSKPSESPKQSFIPKSTLYGNPLIMGTPSAPLASEPPVPPPRGPKNASVAPRSGGAVETGASQPAEGAELARADCEEGQTPTRDAPSAVEQHAPLSPGPNPSPNLYPSVHVQLTSSNPPAAEAQPPAEPSPLQGTSDPVVTPKQGVSPTTFELPSPSSKASSESTQTHTGTAAPPSEAQQPQKESSPNPHPKHDAPETPGASKKQLEGPSTPSSLDPPALVVQESGPVIPMPVPRSQPAPDTMSYLESASLMSGTLESLSGLGEDGSSVGSDSEINGLVIRRTDKYGFLGGTQYSEASEKEIRVDVARQREMKWLDMFSSWDKWILRRFQKVKLRCRKGIPSSLRAKAWQLLSNSSELLESNQGKFEELEREQGDPKWLDIIEKDLHRQFPFHEMFAARGGHGQQDLYRILKAYTIYRPDEGYCQAQAPVAAVLLMHMPAEQAFWCLVQICEKYLPGYYSAGLEAIQLDGEIFFSLLRRVCPMAYRHLKKFKIDPILYMTEWFMCIFSRTLPWSCVLRVWDMFFCEGVKVVFRVGLVLLKQMLGSVDKLREVQGMYETMERLRNIPTDTVKEDLLIQEVISLPVTESLIERECNIQVRKWRESRGELTHQPSRRLHGTRAIFEYKRRAASISSGGSFSFLGAPVPPPGPLRASSSLLSLPGFRSKSKTPFHSHTKMGSFSGPSGADALPPQGFPMHKAAPSGGVVRGPGQHVPSPLTVNSALATSSGQPLASATPAQGGPSSDGKQQLPIHTLSPKIVSEQITQTLPSPTANNAPLPPCPESGKALAAVTAGGGEDESKKKKKSKEDKRREKDEEKLKSREKKEREKAEKERLKKEKERAEKEKKRDKGSKKKDKGGGEAEEKNGATAPRDLA